MKVFITAVLSTFLITIINVLIEKQGFLGLKASDNNYFAILSTIVMSIDIFYIDTKANVNNYFRKIFVTIGVFALVTIVYASLKEIFNTISTEGKFFTSITFNLILMALVCALSSFVYRFIMKILLERKMSYSKLLKQIKHERVFQYDSLRRKKLLTSEVEIKYVNSDEIEEIFEKESHNKSLIELIESEEEDDDGSKVVIKKKKSKLKVSKETKIQKVFDKTNREGK